MPTLTARPAAFTEAALASDRTAAPAANRRLSARARQHLRCPACHGHLDLGERAFVCHGANCGLRFPVVDGVPILLNEHVSVFSTSDFVARRDTTCQLKPSKTRAAFEALLRMLPDINGSIDAAGNYARFRDALPTNASVLVVGGGTLGHGMQALARPDIELVATDVSFGPLTALICDAHDIPFDDASFDGVVVQAVLEHVVDPRRSVDEIHRVLKPGGLVYAETPFMQQVHLGRYDFTRFTHSGHRRLFRRFTEVASGPIAGPGVALAWAYQYYLLSFATSRVTRGLLRAFARLTSFHLKYIDRFLARKPGAIDAASGFFFLGRKDGHTLSDRELIQYYRGALSS